MNNNYHTMENARFTQQLKNSNSFTLPNYLLRFALVFAIILSEIQMASAQVSTLTNWTNSYNNTGNLAGGAVTLPAGSNTYRMLIVAVASSQTAAGSARTATVTYGTQTLTLAAGDMATTTIRQHTAIYYLNEAGIDAAGGGPTLGVTFGGGTVRVNTVWYSVYDFVDQASPFTNSQNYNTAASSTTFVFGTALSLNYDDRAIEVIGTIRNPANTTARTITPAANWTMSNEQTYTTTDGVRNGVYNRSIATTTTTDASSTTISGNAIGSMTGISLNATTKQYRSNVTTGNWGTLGTWQQSMDNGTTWVAATTAPANTDGLVTIRNGHTVTLDANSTVSSLTVEAGATLALSTFTLGSPTSTVLYCGATAGSAITGSGILTLGGNLTVNDDASAGTDDANISCPVALGATRTFTVADDGTSATDLTISGIISGATFGVTKAGAGTMVLSGANSYTGSVTINAGILSANTLANAGAGNTSSLGTGAGTAAITIAGSGTLQYTGIGHSTSRAIILTGGGATIDASGGGTMTLSGGVSGNTFNLVLTGTGAGIESGAIATTSGTLTKYGTGNWTLSGTNSYTGTTTISAGTIITGAAVAASTDGPFGNAASAIVLGDANTTTNNSSPSLLIGGAFGFARTITVIDQATTGTYSIGGNTDNNSTFSGAITINQPLSITQVATTGTNTLSITGGIGSGNAGTKNLTFNNAGTVTISTNAISNASGSISLVKQNIGALTIGVANTFTGGATLTAGTLNINNSDALGTVAGTFVINGGTINNSTGAAITTLNYPQTWGGDFTFTGTQNLNLGTGAVTIGADRQVTVSNNTLTIGGIVSNATRSLTKAGNGILAFGANDVTLNNLTISAGTLTSTSGTLNLAGNYTNNSTFTHNSGTVTFNGTATQAIGGSASTSFNNLTISNTAAAITANINTNVAGTLTMSGANTLLTPDAAVVFNDAGAAGTLTGTGTVKVTRTAVTADFASQYKFLTNTLTNLTVDYAVLAGGQTITALTYGNLKLSNTSSTNTAAGNIVVNGTLTTTSGGTLDLSTYTLTGTLGTITNGGTISTSNTSATPIPTGKTWGGTVIYAAVAGGQTIVEGTYNNLSLSNSGGANNASGAIVVGGVLTLGGQLNTNGNALTINGTTVCGGSINDTGGTVTYNNATSNIIAGTYNNLTIASGVTATLCGATDVQGTLTLNGATLNINSNTLSAEAVTETNANALNISTGTFTVNNNLLLSSNDNITFSGAGTMHVAGNLTVPGNLTCGTLTGNAGTIQVGGSFAPTSFVANTGSVNFDGAATQTIPAFNYYNIISSNTGARTLANSGTIGIAGTFTPDGNTYTLTGSTINYNNAGAQPIAAFTYNNLTISGSGTKTLGGAITVNNNLAISGSATLASDIYQITGNGTGAFSMGAGTGLTLGNTSDATNILFPTLYTSITLDNASTITYQNNSTQTVANLTYGNLTINGGNVKSLAGNTTVANVLTLTSGNLSLETYNLTINNAVSGAFDGSHMVVTDGTGALIKQGSQANASIVYPVGTGAKYTPITLSGTSGVTTGTLSVRAIAGVSSHMTAGSEGLSKYWEIATAGAGYSISSGTLTLTYHTTEALGDPSNLSLAQWTGAAWVKRASTSGTYSIIHTLGSSVAGEWSTTQKATLYSYKDGDWHVANTWTTDPSGTERIGSRVPQDDDKVVILNGYTVTLTANVTTTNNSLSVESGAFLNLADFTFTNTLLNLEGAGTIKSANVSGGTPAAYFPTATTNTFVSAGGGTYEYTNAVASSTFNFPSQTTYNNLKVNIAATSKMVLLNNLTINGNIQIQQGTVQINDATVAARTISVTGNLTIESSAALTVGSANVLHNIVLTGNLTNNGTLDFTNNADYAANTLGAANIEFTGTSNSIVSINTTTSFYGFIVNKGTDQSILVDVITLVNTAPFDGVFATNVITLNNGTVKLGEKITISKFKTSGNYDVSTNQDGKAGIWIDGATATLGTDALVLYGNLKISRGSFNAMGVGQGVVVTREGGSIYIEGGTLTANQIRPSNTASHTGSYIQTAGIVDVKGPATTDDYPVFSWPYAASQFQMTGGTLNVYKPTATGTAVNGGILIGVAAENYSVTGGTVNVYIPASAINFNINSTVPFWNLTIYKEGAGAGTVTLADQPVDLLNTAPPATTISKRSLNVLNNLTIDGTNSPTLNAGGQNVAVKGNFVINTGATYTPGANTTTFNGTAAQSFTNDGTITTGLNKLKIDKSAGTITLGGTATIYTVVDSLIIAQGTINDGGKTINLFGNIYNGGTHTGTGNITMNAAVLRTIEASIFGSPELGNLIINNTNGTPGFVATQLLSNVTVNTLTLTSDHIFDINIYGLTVNSSSIAGGTFSNTRMIRGSGEASDGGLTLAISLTGSYTNVDVATYPVGTNVGGTDRYTPGLMRINGTPGTTSGTYTVIPVNNAHPANLVSGLGVLAYYWAGKYTGFSGINNSTVGFYFTYWQNIPLLWGFIQYDSYFETESGNFQQINNNISGGTSVPFPPGTANLGVTSTVFTAGADAGGISPFNLLVSTFYSVSDGDWNNANTWTTNPNHTGGPAGPPTAGVAGIDRVEIGDATHHHTITISNDARYASVLTINEGSTLTLANTVDHRFSEVTGAGKLRISSNDGLANLPTGDFGDFLGATGGIVEYYTTGTDFTIPTKQGPTENLTPITNYRYLELTPETGHYITMPNTDLEIYNNLTVQGASATGVVRINTTATRTVQINGNLAVTSGNLQFRSGTAQIVTVAGDVSVTSGAIFDLENAGATVSTMSIGGNLTNNGTFDMRAASNCNVTFTGTTNTSITGTTATLTDFNNLIIDKGTSQTSTLTLDVNGSVTSPDNNWLTLSNGTLKYMNSSALNISTTNAFTIAQTAALHIENAGATVTIANSAADNNDLFLNGKLHLVSGTINIGVSTNNNNNDIEYSESGSSELVIEGGTLFVNGQIRRSLTGLGGILKYSQTGGAATINGRNASTARAKFEVLNTGSSFTLTGGSLTLVRGGGISYSDLYLRPATSSTSAAGTILLATATGTGNQTFLVDANIPLSGLTVNGFDGSNTATAKLNINALVLNGGLTINSNATFNTNNLNLSLTGNFANAGTFTSGTTDVTTFNGATQTLSGNNTTFNNLAINPSASVTLQSSSNITVNKELRILSGTLDDGGNTISVKRNVINYTSHTSSSGTGGIKLNGTLNQIISGNADVTPATFGRLEVDNTAGVLLQDDVTIGNLLTITNGAINVDGQLITIATGASIAGAPFSVSKMIYTNGSTTTTKPSKGLTMPIPITATSGEVFFPIGANGKYTPVRIPYTRNDVAGTINVNPINNYHPTALLPNDILQYYWIITSTGISNFKGDIYMTYLNADVRVTGSNTESQYISGHLTNDKWEKLSSMVDYTNDIVQFPYSSLTSSISGAYTAGIDAALPIDVPIYYSNVATGNWGDVSSWTPTPPSGVPSGAIMVIMPGHTITMETTDKKAYKTTINGTLNVGTTDGHYLGIVNGTGILSLTGPKLPAGDFNTFFSCSGGSLNYGGSTDYTMSLIPTTLRQLILSGSGKRIMPNKDITICELIDITETATLDNTLNNRTIFLNGSMSRASGASFLSGTGSTAEVIFQGSSLQVLGDFTAANAFNHIELNNSAGLTLINNVDMKGDLTLTNGVLTTSTSTILYMKTGTSAVSPAGGSAASYISGPLKKNITGGYLFKFPIGKDTRYGAASIYLANDGDWTAEYFNTGRTGTPGLASPLTAASTTEYWTIRGPASSDTYVTLRWDNLSDVRPEVVTGGQAGIRVAEFNTGTSEWNEKSTTTAGTDANGTAVTNDKMTFPSSVHDYTLASATPVYPRARFSSTESVCMGGSNTIPVEFTGISGNTPYTLKYTIDGGADITKSGITTLTTTIPASSNGIYKIKSFTYTTGTGLVDATTVTVSSSRNWDGSVSTDWNTAANWTCPEVPTSAADITIPSGMPNAPLIPSGAAACKNITINPGAVLTLSSGTTLDISGDWTNNGTFTAPASSAVTFNGAANQNIAGLNPSTYNDLTINKTGASGTDVVTLNKPTTVNHALTLTDGIISSSATNLLIIADEATLSGGSQANASFVDGPVQKVGNNNFTFPVGDIQGANRVYAPLGLNNTSGGANTDKFTVSYSYTPALNNTTANMIPVLDHVSKIEVWDVARTVGTATPPVTLYWTDAARSGITNSADLVVAHYTSSKWHNMGGTASGTYGVGGTGSVVSTVAFTSYSPITYGSIAGVNPLPVEMLFFEGKANDENIELFWATASEKNNDYFEVQRSIDAQNFVTIGKIYGGGNSMVQLDYTYIDENPNRGTNYYRLKQVDYDGASEVHKTIAVTWNGTGKYGDSEDINVYPNPYNGGDLILGLQKLEPYTSINLSIMDISGKQIYRASLIVPEDQNVNLIPRAVDGLRQGIYFISVQTTKKVMTKKVVVN